MGHKFNQPIKLPSTLTTLDMGHKFNQPIKLPLMLTYLNMGHYLDQLIKLPSTLEFLIKSSSTFTQTITLLSPSQLSLIPKILHTNIKYK